MEKKCCICGKEFNGFGNNALPIKDGTCCDTCNSKFVIPIRIINAVGKVVDNCEIAKNHFEYVKLQDKLIKKNFEILKTIPYITIYQNPETEETVAVCII